METYELESEIHAALIGNTELINALPNGANSIYHYVSPSVDPARFPIIVYSPISDVPALSGDNQEFAHRVTIRIHVIASQKRFAADESKFLTVCRLVNQIMPSLDFSRQRTTPYTEDGKIMMIFDYIRGVES